MGVELGDFGIKQSQEGPQSNERWLGEKDFGAHKSLKLRNLLGKFEDVSYWFLIGTSVTTPKKNLLDQNNNNKGKE